MSVNTAHHGNLGSRLWVKAGTMLGLTVLSVAGASAQQGTVATSTTQTKDVETPAETYHPAATGDVGQLPLTSRPLLDLLPAVAAPVAPNSLTKVPQFFPMGTTHFDAKYYLKFIPKALPEVTVERDGQHIEVDIPGRSPVTIVPGGRDVSLGIGGQTYDATLETTKDGFSAVVNDQKSVDFKGHNGGVEIDPHGFTFHGLGVPGHIQLTPIKP